MEHIDVSKLNDEQRRQLLTDLQKDDSEKKRAKREAYETTKAIFVEAIFSQVDEQKELIDKFNADLLEGLDDFQQIMMQYGHLASGQRSFTLIHKDMKMVVKSNNVKRFDERGDMAAARLVVFLKDWIKKSEKGKDDPLYVLAMKTLERNKAGDLDYKRVSDLYELEGRFANPEYTSIMELFRESHIVDGTVTHYYFYRKSAGGVWNKIELSFNQLKR